MKPAKFCSLLQRFAEITNCERPNVAQWSKVVEKLGTVETENCTETSALKAFNFVLWLKGYVEISQVAAPNEREWSIIRKRLRLVFTE